MLNDSSLLCKRLKVNWGSKAKPAKGHWGSQTAERFAPWNVQECHWGRERMDLTDPWFSKFDFWTLTSQSLAVLIPGPHSNPPELEPLRMEVQETKFLQNIHVSILLNVSI